MDASIAPATSYFNPRSRTGSDASFAILSRRMLISTHAPARGATEAAKKKLAECQFQPTLPHGERPTR